uniref:Uncharacterized protein n=1 Tax=Nelumbo nucifera TaxID=4432 RepID=A0A822ZTU5_NELNU|nr:TPA_asm: hypothetical protein HUJ06_016712 [Nelumbo nucifera]
MKCGINTFRQLCTIFSESGTNGGYDHSSHQVLDGGAPCLLPGQETASMSIDPGAASIALDDSSSESEEHIDMLDVQNKHQSATPTSGRRKRNRKGIDDVIAEAILDIAVASKLRTTALTQSSEQFSISNCIKALDEIQGIDDRIYFAALDLFDSSSARETFLSLKNDKRLTWLKGKCDAPSTSTV